MANFSSHRFLLRKRFLFVWVVLALLMVIPPAGGGRKLLQDRIGSGDLGFEHIAARPIKAG